MVQFTDEELVAEFSDLGVDIDRDDILDKLRMLGQLHRVDAGELAAQWVAYSHNKNGCEVLLETLDTFERERLSKVSKNTAKTPVRKKTAATNLYDSYTLPLVVEDDVSEDLIGAYSSTSNTSGKKKRQLTPESSTRSKRFSNDGTPKSTRSAPFTHRSFSPVVSTSSQEYGKRKNAGEVVCEFGARKTTRWHSRSSIVKISDIGGMSEVMQRFKYMFQKLMDKAFVLDDQIESMAKLLKLHHNIGDLAHVAMPVQETVTVVGRLCCDSDGKLNAKSVILEGSRETSGGRHIQLDLSAIERYSLFPGQIVALDGTNSTGKTFVASKLYQGVPLPLAKHNQNSQEGAVSVVVAAGPFTTSDCLSYEPLEDLMKYLAKETPDVCILIGPFVDSRHSEIEKLPMTYDDFFLTIIAKIADCTQSLSMELVVLPSQWDVHHDPVFPQPPFQFGSILERKIHFMSDPCTLNINGVVFGVTSTDILLHLGKEEISSRAGGDRLGRLAQHLITQHR
ncbi:DNA polymerase alpha subunit B [Lamellibrachia satsuma]|nr:DNA polymerase alpha subunit B [Lamellibrachia satsuma]